jgi:hypothetical protein
MAIKEVTAITEKASPHRNVEKRFFYVLSRQNSEILINIYNIIAQEKYLSKSNNTISPRKFPGLLRFFEKIKFFSFWGEFWCMSQPVGEKNPFLFVKGLGALVGR